MTAEELEKLLAEVTPGEWQGFTDDQGYSNTGGAYVGVYADDMMSIAHVLCTDHVGRGKSIPYHANARLIAMAPALARRVIAAERMAEALGYAIRGSTEEWWAEDAREALAAYEAAK